MSVRRFVWVAAVCLLAGCGTEEVYVSGLSADQVKAVDAAVRHAGFEGASDVHLKKCEYNFGLSKRYYEVKFKRGWYEYEYEVDASNGAILKMKKEFDW